MTKHKQSFIFIYININDCLCFVKSNIDELSRVLELQLRDFIWTKLTSDNLTIDFGYDYYMYVTSKQMIPHFHNSKFGNNIYIEENIKSPYTDV